MKLWVIFMSFLSRIFTKRVPPKMTLKDMQELCRLRDQAEANSAAILNIK